METETTLSAEIIRILPKAAIARKYNCSVQYVRKILQGSSQCNSSRARSIRRDAFDISRILLRDISVQNFSWGNVSAKEAEIRE